MARAKTCFVCGECGARSLKWQGQCDACGAWNSLTESEAAGTSLRTRAHQGDNRVCLLSAVEPEACERHSTGLGELDRVLGGGLVRGSVILLGGDPGIGKSTLLLQAVAGMSGPLSALYVSGEESPHQISMRADRLGLAAGGVRVLTETCVESVVEQAARERPGVLVVDSIQTMFCGALESAPGTVGQLRESASRLVRFAKETGTAIFLIGHVTKEGLIAGPRVLEHMVDTVLYFESDLGSRLRIVRAVKNRFGAADEIGVFAMTAAGLRQVPNPSAMFLSRHGAAVPGSAIMVAREGTRPLLVEVQALVDQSHAQNSRRVAVGLEQSRLALLLAVLHRHGGVPMYDQDVFINVVGGVRVSETAADLPALLATLSSFRDRRVRPQSVVFGEVGLAGEIRPVPFGEERLQEAAKHGFRRALVPAANAPRNPIEDMEVRTVERLAEAMDYGLDAE